MCRMKQKSKRCGYCKQRKALRAFYNHRRSPDGKHWTCKKCRKQQARTLKESESVRNANYKKLYGITLKDYNDMLKQQNSCCAICKRPQEQFKQRLSVDHCHM